MKKLISFLLMLLSLAVITSYVKVNASTGQYYTETVTTNKLEYGVVHTLAKGYTSTPLTGDEDGPSGPSTGSIIPGQFYQQQVNVLDIPYSSGAKIVNWANLNNHKWTLTSVKGLIADYELKHPGWRVVAAINGDFFDINANGNLPYQTNNSVVTGGDYFKATTGPNVGITNNGTPDSLIGGNPVRTDTMKLAVYDAQENIINTFNIEKINSAPGVNQTSVYYAVYGSNKVIIPKAVDIGTNNGYFVDNADLALPNADNSFYGKGTITSTESKTISTGQFAIVTNNPYVIAALKVGVKIRTQWEYKGAYAGVDTVAGCGDTLMTGGVINTTPSTVMTVRHPRTVIGKKADGSIIMMVVDGRQVPDKMYGADFHEVGAIMKYYGAVDAYNLDGGGSSTVVIRQNGELKVMNSPSDGRERNDSNALLVVTRDPEMDYQVIEKGETTMKIKADLGNSYSHHIDKLYVRVNAVTKEVINDEVSFTGLRANRDYKVEFFYRTPSSHQYQLNFSDTQWTLKRVPTFDKVDLIEDSVSYTLEPRFFDQDQATDLLTAKVLINNVEHHFTNGKLVLNKGEVTSLDEVVLEYTIDIGDGNVQKFVIVNPHFLSTMTLNIIIDEQLLFVDGVYK